MSRSYYTPVHSSEADVEAAAELIQWQTHSAKTVKHIIEDFLDITGDVWAVIVIRHVYIVPAELWNQTPKKPKTPKLLIDTKGAEYPPIVVVSNKK